MAGTRAPGLRGRTVKVQIEQPVAGQDTYGAPSTNWTSFAANVPATFTSISGSERYGDHQIEAIERYDVSMRYVRGVTEKMRLNFTNDGRTYLMDIENVTNVHMRNRMLVLRCKAGVNRG